MNIIMKRIYKKPEIRTLSLRFATFVTASNGSETTGYEWENGSSSSTIGENTGDPEGGGGGSRYLRKSMWDD